jgi:hypothetical protein
MKYWIARAPATTAVLLLLTSSPIARKAELGSIEGLISDDLGPVANASVEARNTMTGVFIDTQSDASGRYKLMNLRAGRYSLWVQAAGHNSQWIPSVVVERGQISFRDLQLGRTRAPATSSTSGLKYDALLGFSK